MTLLLAIAQQTQGAGETLAEDWWSTAQNVGQVIVTLALPLIGAVLAFRKWGMSKTKNWVRDAVGMDGGSGDVATKAEADRMVDTVLSGLDLISAKLDLDLAEHEQIKSKLDAHKDELAGHIMRHDAKADGIEFKVDRVERSVDRIMDALLRRNE